MIAEALHRRHSRVNSCPALLGVAWLRLAIINLRRSVARGLARSSSTSFLRWPMHSSARVVLAIVRHRKSRVRLRSTVYTRAGPAYHCRPTLLGGTLRRFA